MVNKVFLGLGSNLGEPQQNLRQAISYLQAEPNVTVDAVSSVYKTKPLAGMQQPDYFNLMAAISTNLTASELLVCNNAIETKMLRDRNVPRWSARIIDIDIILFNQDKIDIDGLVVPHYGMKERSFVLYPLLEIAIDATMPSGEKVQSIWQQANLPQPELVGEL